MPLRSITAAWESGELLSCGFTLSEVQCNLFSRYFCWVLNSCYVLGLSVLEISFHSTFKTVDEFCFRDLIPYAIICIFFFFLSIRIIICIYTYTCAYTYGIIWFYINSACFIVLTISLLPQIEDFIKAIFADSTLRKECLWRIENVPL